MEKRYDMTQFAPLFVDKQKAQVVYEEIQGLDPTNNTIIMDMSGIISMTTICAKIIFGRLCKHLGPEKYHSNIKFVGKSEGLDIVIRMGIASALQDDFA